MNNKTKSGVAPQEVAVNTNEEQTAETKKTAFEIYLSFSEEDKDAMKSGV